MDNGFACAEKNTMCMGTFAQGYKDVSTDSEQALMSPLRQTSPHFLSSACKEWRTLRSAAKRELRGVTLLSE